MLSKFAQNIVTWLMGDYEVNWENDGAVFITPYWLEKYSNITKIGETTGLVINKFRVWLFDYQDNNKHFEPVEVVSELGDQQFLPSVMCHDLFYNALYHLYELGFEPHPESPIFRDHIVVYAKKVEEVDFNSNFAEKQAIIRFFRLFESFMHVINQQFTNIRGLLVSSSFLFVQPYLFKNGKYYKVEMTPPYVNYCYLEVHMPPKRKASLFEDEKLCALEGNLTTNATITFLSQLTYGHLIFVLENFSRICYSCRERLCYRRRFLQSSSENS